MSRFNLPLSTTTDQMVALKFMSESGLLLKLRHFHDRYGVMKFECASFSCFTEERETLFYGNTVLRIQGVIQRVDSTLMHYDVFMEPINALIRMINGLSIRNQQISNTKIYKKAMRIIIGDILRFQSLEQQHSIESPKYIWNLVLFHVSNTPRIRLLWNSLLTGYQWIHSILRKQSVDTLDIANIAVLFNHSEDITFLMRGDTAWNETECMSVLNDMVSISKMAMTVTIHFVWSSMMPHSTRTHLEDVVGNLDDIGCGCSLNGKSVSFTFKAIENGDETERVFEQRIDAMIKNMKSKRVKRKNARLADNDVFQALSQSDLGTLIPFNVRELVMLYVGITL